MDVLRGVQKLPGPHIKALFLAHLFLGMVLDPDVGPSVCASSFQDILLRKSSPFQGAVLLLLVSSAYIDVNLPV